VAHDQTIPGYHFTVGPPDDCRREAHRNADGDTAEFGHRWGYGSTVYRGSEAELHRLHMDRVTPSHPVNRRLPWWLWPFAVAAVLAACVWTTAKEVFRAD